MPLSTAAKAALCICPPAAMIGTVATVPAAKRAVHHLTARPAPKTVRHTASTPARATPVTQPVDCIPAAPGVVPAVPLVTYASPIPDEPGSEAGAGAPAPFIAASAGNAPVGVGPIAAPTSGPDVTPGPVPEPATWLLLIVGIGSVGATLRIRRRQTICGTRLGYAGGKAATGMTLWSGTAAVEAGDMATTVAMKSMVAGVAGKAMLCVCPAAIVAGSVMTVSPLRQAVNAATATPGPALPIATSGSQALPCIEPATIPVSATSIKGFPDAVDTVAGTRRLNATPTASTLT